MAYEMSERGKSLLFALLASEHASAKKKSCEEEKKEASPIRLVINPVAKMSLPWVEPDADIRTYKL